MVTYLKLKVFINSIALFSYGPVDHSNKIQSYLAILLIGNAYNY